MNRIIAVILVLVGGIWAIYSLVGMSDKSDNKLIASNYKVYIDENFKDQPLLVPVKDLLLNQFFTEEIIKDVISRTPVADLIKDEELTKKRIAEERLELESELSTEFDADDSLKSLIFTYEDLQTKASSSSASLTFIKPKVTAHAVRDDGDEFIEIVMDKLVLSKQSGSDFHWKYDNSGDLNIYANINPNIMLGQPMERTEEMHKILTIRYGKSYGEWKLDFKEGEYFASMMSNNQAVIEGRGNTALYSVGLSSFGLESRFDDDNNMEMFLKTDVQNYVLGDAFKALLAVTEPVSYGLDFRYVGDDMINMAIVESQIKKQMKDLYIKRSAAEVFKEFSAEILLENLYGSYGDARLEFSGGSQISDGEVSGTLYLTDLNHFANVLSQRFPSFYAKAYDSIVFLRELGKENSYYLQYDFEVDGDGNLSINGKSPEELEKIGGKLFDKSEDEFEPDYGFEEEGQDFEYQGELE